MGYRRRTDSDEIELAGRFCNQDSRHNHRVPSTGQQMKLCVVYGVAVTFESLIKLGIGVSLHDANWKGQEPRVDHSSSMN